MAFMLWWPMLVEHKDGWQTSGDMWGIFRAAHYIGWGYLGGVYDPTTGVNSLPGIEIILAPIAMLTGHFGLTESFSPFFIARPTAALVLMPIELILASSIFFAIDALAEHFGSEMWRRALLSSGTLVLMWPTVAVWGHAEDCFALAIGVYSLIAALKGRWKACGWLFAIALLTQPLVVMMLPLLIGTAPAGRRVATALRACIPSLAIAGVAFASNAGNSFRALVLQPTPPSGNDPTPWVSLAPHLLLSVPKVGRQTTLIFRAGKFIERSSTTQFHTVALVSGGAGRSIEIILAGLLGLYVWRRPQPAVKFIWLAAVCLGMRSMFEAVMLPYYLGPPLILAMAVASLQSRTRFAAAMAVSIGTMVFAYCCHLGPWAWWLPVVVGMASVLALGYPHALPLPASPAADDLSELEGTDMQLEIYLSGCRASLDDGAGPEPKLSVSGSSTSRR